MGYHSDPFQEGYDAYVEGLSLTDNPYAHGSVGANDWENGWFAAEDDLAEFEIPDEDW